VFERSYSPEPATRRAAPARISAAFAAGADDPEQAHAGRGNLARPLHRDVSAGQAIARVQGMPSLEASVSHSPVTSLSRPRTRLLARLR